MKKIALWAMCIAVMVLSGCRKAPEWKAEHVFVIGLDGWGAYSVEKADMPNVKAFPHRVQRVAQGGSRCRDGRTV